MRRRIGVLLTAAVTLGATQLVAAAPASAQESICQPIVDDVNGDWVVWVCVDVDDNHQGLPRVHVHVGAPGTSVDATVSVVTGHIPQQQQLCVGLLEDTARPIQVCLLPAL
jgi:hypothetical protein